MELRQYAQVLLIEKSGGWAIVARDGKLGYVKMKLLGALQ
jgi:hypothetical protein